MKTKLTPDQVNYAINKALGTDQALAKAAGPELLECLEEVLAWFEGQQGKVAADHVDYKLFDKVLLAVMKAKGEM